MTRKLASVAMPFVLMASTAALAWSAPPSSGCPLSGHPAAAGGYLGVDVEDLTEQQRAQLQAPLRIQDRQGVAIAAVDQDAPAAAAGLQAGDILLRINNQPAQSALQVRDFLRQMKPGQKISLTMLHNGSVSEKSVLLANRKDVEQRAWAQHYSVPAPNTAPQQVAHSDEMHSPQNPPTATPPTPAAVPLAADPSDSSGLWNETSSEFSKVFGVNGMVMSWIPKSWIPWNNALYTGVELDAMGPQLAAYFHIQPGTGLLVRSVDTNSPGARAGLHAGDVVL